MSKVATFKLLFLFVIISIIAKSLCHKKIKIAIVGSGISGLSTAYHMYKNHFLSNLKEGYSNYQIESIDIYEKESEIGGRMYTFKYDNEIINPTRDERTYVDMGASFIIKENLLAMELIELTDTELIDIPEDEKFVLIMNNNLESLITLDGGFYLNFMKFIYKYKLALVNSSSLVDEFHEQFKKIYDWLDKGNSYDSISEFCIKNNFENLVSESTYNYFKSRLNLNFIDEVLSAFIRSCYNQDTNINAFAGNIILTAIIKKSFFLKYGFNSFLNRLLLKLQNYPESIFKNDIKKIFNSATTENKRMRMKDSIEYYIQPEIRIITDSKVKSITRVLKSSNKKTQYPRYSINEDKEEYYDYVIFSANISESDVTFINFDNDSSTYKFSNSSFDNLNRFVHTSEVIVKGKIDNSKFKIDNDLKFSAILFNNHLDYEIYANISDIIKIKEDIYKIQVSNSVVDTEKLLKLFQKNAVILKVKSWKNPYPNLKAIDKENISMLSSFKLFGDNNGIFFNNSIENIASCVELSIISAKNTANLIHNLEENGGINIEINNESKFNEKDKKNDL